MTEGTVVHRAPSDPRRGSEDAKRPRVLNKYRDVPTLGAVSIMRPSKWGNPWSHQPYAKGKYKVGTRQEAVSAFRLWFLTSGAPEAVLLREMARRELRGKDLICCCAPAQCHGEALLEYANAPLNGGCKVCPEDGPCSHLDNLRKINALE